MGVKMKELIENCVGVKKLTPCQQLGYKVGDKFEILKTGWGFTKGQIVTLYEDNESICPLFEGENSEYSFHFNKVLVHGAYLSLSSVKPITPPKKMLTIVRGIPGSGKSTLASLITPHHFEADQFFVGEDGVYRFDGSKLKQAHAQCFEKVEKSMRVFHLNHIVVSNTFTRKKEITPYIDLAVENGYEVRLITIDGVYDKNVHNVPEEKVQEMKDRFEKLTLEDFGL
jgi:hypothetical protein